MPPTPRPAEAEASALPAAKSGVSKPSKTKRKEVSGALSSVAKLADSLEGVLAEKSAASGAKPLRKGTLGAKARMRLISTETERFAAVVQHAAFQESPFETIERHLVNSVAAQALARATAQPAKASSAAPSKDAGKLGRPVRPSAGGRGARPHVASRGGGRGGGRGAGRQPRGMGRGRR